MKDILTTPLNRPDPHPSTNTKRDLAPTPPHKMYPHSSVDIAYRKVLHVQPEDGQH